MPRIVPTDWRTVDAVAFGAGVVGVGAGVGGANDGAVWAGVVGAVVSAVVGDTLTAGATCVAVRWLSMRASS